MNLTIESYSEVYSEEIFFEVIDFLIKYEKFCVTLVDYFLQYKDKAFIKKYISFFIIREKTAERKIMGIVLLTKGGSVLHQFDESVDNATGSERESVVNLLKTVIDASVIKGIVGKSQGTDIIKDAVARIPSTCWDYDLLTYKPTVINNDLDKKNVPCNDSSYVKNIIDNRLPSSNVFVRCTDGTYIRTITELEAPYIFKYFQTPFVIEDVLPKGEKFNEQGWYLDFLESVRKGAVAILFKNNHPVSQVRIGDFGINYVSLSGVYTEKHSRNQGFAAKIVKSISTFYYMLEHKNISLFVKKNNIPAICAYKKAHYSYEGDYKICYYE